MNRLLPLLVLAGCAKSLADLEPYPCASSIPYCPEGRACLGGTCVRAVVDAACDDYVDCTLADGSAVCVGGTCTTDFNTLTTTCLPGLCELPCTDGSCAAGHTCDTALGACLLDCSNGCPPRSTCQLLANGRACVPDPR